MRPVWVIAAAALVALLIARRRRLEPGILIAGALGAVGMAVYSTGLIELPQIDRLLEDIGRALGAWTYLLVGVLAFMEAAAFLGLLVPGETAIIVGGVVAGQGQIDLVALIALAWAAAFAGDLTGYALGRRHGRPFLIRHGKGFGLTEDRVRMVEGFFERHGGKAIFVGRFVGIVRSLSPFLAGSSRMALGRFVPYDILGSGIQTTLLCLVGFAFWRSIDRVLELAKQGALALSATLVVVVALVVAARWLRGAANRARLRRWLAEHDNRLAVRLLTALLRRVERPARFLVGRLTPGGLGLELTTLLAVASVAGYVFVGYLIVLDDVALTPADRRGLAWADGARAAALDEIASALSHLGSLPVVGVALGIVAAGLIAHRAALEGAALLVGLALTVAGVSLTQGAVDRLALPSSAGAASYPAAQAAYAVAWVAVAVALRGALPRLAHKALLLATAIVVATAVALSAVYLGEGWFSDAAGGLGLGALAFSATGAVGLVIAQRAHERRGATTDPEG
jgi:membrane protein DedA with SNARE-associated domain